MKALIEKIIDFDNDSIDNTASDKSVNDFDDFQDEYNKKILWWSCLYHEMTFDQISEFVREWMDDDERFKEQSKEDIYEILDNIIMTEYNDFQDMIKNVWPYDDGRHVYVCCDETGRLIDDTLHFTLEGLLEEKLFNNRMIDPPFEVYTLKGYLFIDVHSAIYPFKYRIAMFEGDNALAMEEILYEYNDNYEGNDPIGWLTSKINKIAREPMKYING